MRQSNASTLPHTATTTPRAAILSCLLLAVGCADVDTAGDDWSDTGAAWRGDVSELDEWSDDGFARKTGLHLSCPSSMTSVSYDGKVDYEVDFPQDDFWLGNGSCGTFNTSAEAAAELAQARLEALSECEDDAPTFTCDDGCVPLTRPGTCTVSTERVSLAAEIAPDASGAWSCVLRFEVTAKATDHGVCLQAGEPPRSVEGSGQLADG